MLISRPTSCPPVASANVPKTNNPNVPNHYFLLIRHVFLNVSDSTWYRLHCLIPFIILRIKLQLYDYDYGFIRYQHDIIYLYEWQTIFRLIYF